MYKIQGVNRINSEVLTQYPYVKEKIILEMLINFSKEMYKNKCFEVSEVSGLKNTQYMDADEIELHIKGYVITPDEYKEIIKTLHFIKDALPDEMKGYANHLHNLLTKTPSI